MKYPSCISPAWDWRSQLGRDNSHPSFPFSIIAIFQRSYLRKEFIQNFFLILGNLLWDYWQSRLWLNKCAVQTLYQNQRTRDRRGTDILGVAVKEWTHSPPHSYTNDIKNLNSNIGFYIYACIACGLGR